MDSQSSSSPYGLRSLVECASRAALLSESEDIPDFLNSYVSELVTFRDSNNETDPKVACFLYEEQLENKLLGNVEGTTRTAESKGTTDTCKTQWPTYSTSEDISAQGPSMASKLSAPTRPRAPVIAEESLPLNKQSITPEVLEPESIRPRPTPPKAPKPESTRIRLTIFKAQGPKSTRGPAPTSHHAPVIAEESLPLNKQSITPEVPEPESIRTWSTPPKAPKPERTITRLTIFKAQGPKSTRGPAPTSHHAPVIAEESLPLNKQSITPEVPEPESIRTRSTPPKAPKPERTITRPTRPKVQGPESTRGPARTSHHAPVIAEESLPLNKQSITPEVPEPESIRTRSTPPKAPKPECTITRPTRPKVQGPESTRGPAPTSHHAPVMAHKSVLPPILQKERAVLPQPRSHQAPVIARKSTLLQKQSTKPRILEPQNTRTWPIPPKDPKQEHARTQATRSKVQGPESTRRPAPTSHHGPVRSRAGVTFSVHVPERSTERHKPVPGKTRTQFITPRILEPERFTTRPTPPKAPKPESARKRPTTSKVLDPESIRTRRKNYVVPKPHRKRERCTQSRPTTSQYLESDIVQIKLGPMSTPKVPNTKECLSPTEIPKIDHTGKKTITGRAVQAINNWTPPVYLEVSDAQELAEPPIPSLPKPSVLQFRTLISKFRTLSSAEKLPVVEMPAVKGPYRHTCPHLAKKLGIINFAHLEV